jgi:hypothetical protein
MEDRSADRLSPGQLAGFTVAVGLSAIFVDAAVGHGLTWENDPYWTYWVTKTFLIATIFGLCTAWFGVGLGRGAVITVVHTLVLTIYYWTLSPIGLPSIPTWLDLEHTWITGLPIHFGVIYLGYVLVLWMFRRRQAGIRPLEDAFSIGTRSLIFGAAIVVVAGGVASFALGEFPGVTWFVVRLLLTVTFLVVWWGVVGSDLSANVVGAVVLAFAWATYAQFVGPVGLPDTPLRILDSAPPPATVRWLDYKELWAVSLPIYLIVMLAVLVLASRNPEWGRSRRQLAVASLVPVVLFTTGLTVDTADRGVSAEFSAAGNVELSTGETATGEIRIGATDMGGRVTPLPPHDEISIQATIDSADSWELLADQPIVDDPTGEEPTWWGVGFDVDYREGDQHFKADLVAYAFGTLTRNGEIVAEGIPVEVVASRDRGYGLELVVGSDVTPVPGLNEGTLGVTWATFSGETPESASFARYAVGGIVLLLLVIGAVALARRAERDVDREAR